MLSEEEISIIARRYRIASDRLGAISLFARAIEAAVLPELDVLCEYTGQNGMREWNDVGAWLRPGECIAVVTAPKAQSCDMGELCIGCSPRNPDGTCPDAAQAEKQEPVAFVHRNEAGQISMKASDGSSFDMSKFVGSSLYTRPQPDLTAEVERLKLSAEHWNRLYREKCQEFHDAQANKGHEIVWLIDRIAALEEAAREARDAFEQHDGNYKLSKASGAVVEAAIAKLDAVLGNAEGKPTPD